MGKHIIIPQLYESGGTNQHFKLLTRYLGADNMTLLLESEEQWGYLKNITSDQFDNIRILKLEPYAHLLYLFTTNVKEAFRLLLSLANVFAFSIKNGFADVTITVAEPERYLYLLWLPFIRVNYILHTTPANRYTSFTTRTCNRRLGRNKKIITVSSDNKSAIIKNWNISGTKEQFVRVIPNCLLKDYDVPVQHGEIKNQVVTVGHVISYKNPAIWLDVAKLVTASCDVNFVWLGNGPLLKQFQSLTANGTDIQFIGLVNDPEEFLKDACIYYQPSTQETQGIAVLEAMAHGLPCVVSNAGGLPESVADGYNGIVVDPLEVAQHVNAIIKLMTNADLRNSYGANSYRRSKELFTYDKFRAKMNTVYLD